MSSGVFLVFGIFLLIILSIALIWYFGFRQKGVAPIYRADLNGGTSGQQGDFQMRLSPDNTRASYDLLVNSNVQTATLSGPNGVNYTNLTLSPVAGFTGWSRGSGVISVSPELVSALKSKQLQITINNVGTFTIN